MNNQGLFNNLKQQIIGYNNDNSPVFMYPALKDMTFENNILTYLDNSITFNDNEFFNVDRQIFTLNSKDCMSILNILNNNAKNPKEIEQKYNRIVFLELLQSPIEENYTEISKYINEYFEKQNLYNKYPNEIIYNEVNVLRDVLTRCYISDYQDRPICKYIESEFNKKIDELNQSSQGTSNAYVKVKKDPNNLIVIPSEENTFIDKAAGFANTTLIISLTTTLGITIALLTLFFLK